MIRYSARTDIGCRRKGNEDALLALAESGVFVVADGVGGRVAGEVASAIVVETFRKSTPALVAALATFEASPDWQNRNAVLEALDHVCQVCSKTVYDQAEATEMKGMTTTLVAALVGAGSVFLAHVGDSRAWLVRDGHLRQLTEDHSMVNELIRSGQMTAEEAKRSRYRSVITRAIGLYPTVQADLMAIDVMAGDRIVLNSDGLSDPVPLNRIEDLAGQTAIDDTANLLVEAALANGGPDNVTVVVFEPTPNDQAENNRARAQVLEELFLFRDLPYHARLRVSRICEEHFFSPGDTLVSEGTPGDAMHVIVAGEVSAQHGGVEVARIRAGETFGELSLIDDQPRSASVVARTFGTSVIIRRTQLQEFCQREPDLGNRIMWRLVATIGQRLRDTTARAVRLAQGGVDSDSLLRDLADTSLH